MLISVNGVFVSADVHNILISLRLKYGVIKTHNYLISLRLLSIVPFLHILLSRTLYNKYKDTDNIKKIDPINIF
jgi:hypothetical protein